MPGGKLGAGLGLARSANKSHPAPIERYWTMRMTRKPTLLARIPLVERHFVFAEGKRLRDRHAARRDFVIFTTVFAVRAHGELASRHADHLRTLFAVLDDGLRRAGVGHTQNGD